MSRIERRLFRITDQIAEVDGEIRLTEEELRFHRHLDDDARRDAAVGGPVERDDARETGKDVAVFERLLDGLVARRRRLEEKRLRLLEGLD